MLSILFWILRHSKKGDIVILPPAALWITFILKIFGNCKIHLDVRTVPVDIHTLKKRVLYFLYWHLPFKLFSHIPDGYSFITMLLKISIEKELKLRFNNFVLWHSGVNVDHFRMVREHYSNTGDIFKITYVGVVTKNRGLDRVIHAISEIGHKYNNKIKFNIIGDGPFLDKLKIISAESGLSDQTSFQGYVAYENVPKYLLDTDIFICPLPDREEWNISSPIKVYEYLACDRPVILTPIKAHKNIINDAGNIIWTQGDSSADFSAAIEKAYQAREYLRMASKDAVRLIKDQCQWSAQGRKFAQYLKFEI